MPRAGAGSVAWCVESNEHWSGRVGFGILHLIFRLGQVLGQKFWPVPDPSHRRVGLGQVFFERVGSGLSGQVAHD